MKLFIDSETYNEEDIGKGDYAYAETAELLLVSYAIDDAPEQVWDCTQDPMPDYLAYALENADLFVIHNSMFDRPVFYHNGIDIPIDRTWDTMAQALAHALPPGLAQLCEVLGLDAADLKDPRGKKLIQKFCKPHKTKSGPRRHTKETDPEDWEAFKEYARSDIRAMRAAFNRIPTWNYRGPEREIWKLDQYINERGLPVDRTLASRAVSITRRVSKKLKEETSYDSLGIINSPTQRDKLLKFIYDVYGVELNDLTKQTLTKIVGDPNLDDGLRFYVSNRLQISKASTSKFNNLLKSVSSDGYLRGCLQFAGAERTRRWAGRKFQPQNLPNPSRDQQEIEQVVDWIKKDTLEQNTDDPMQAISDCIRASIVAPQGYKFCIVDLSNIEGRFAAWIANEAWKIQAFKDFDAGEGHDLYKLSYCAAFGGKPENVTKDERKIGKVMELMLQYGGGVGAFLTGAFTNGLDIQALTDHAIPALPRPVKQEALDFYYWRLDNDMGDYGLTKAQFVACDALKRIWRKNHPAIVQMWYDLEDAFRSCVGTPDEVRTAGKVKAIRNGAWLRIVLPSGNCLCYPGAHVKDDGSIAFKGRMTPSRKWGVVGTYGGKLMENICQSGSRDAMAHRMHAVEEDGYAIRLTVHDELVCTAPDNRRFSVSEVQNQLETPPDWAVGLPLATEGEEAYRYGK